MRFASLALVLMTAPLALAQTQTTLYPGQSGATLLASIRSGYTPTSTLGYDRARDDLYTYEQATDGALCGVYTQFCIQLTPGADPTTDAFSKGINAEHTWPQGRGAASEPARGDMHHLFPSKVSVNSERGSDPFREIPDAETDGWYRGSASRSTPPTTLLGEWSEDDNAPFAGFAGSFEPRDDHKGDAARAVFYFAAIYASQVAAEGEQGFFDAMADDLILWHYADPVSAEEAARSTWIASKQGRENPFVLDSTLARRAYNLSGGDTGGGGEGTSGDLWVNEIHYDNAGGDANEGVEIAGPAGTSLAGWSLEFYNGSGGAVYASVALSGTVPDQQGGYGTVWVPVTGVQNGAPDGVALVAPDGAVAEFLSYEGAFAATGGPASGQASTDIGVAETNSTPVGQSLQLSGAGDAVADFVWNAPAVHTRGAPNTGQTFGGATVAGAAGWRMVAPAATGLTVDDLAALNLVQGVPGFYPAAETNLYTGYDGSAYTVTGIGAPLAPGRGVFWYLYDEDIAPGGPSQSVALPMTLATDNATVTTDTDVTLSAVGDGSNLLGNPFATSLDVSDVASWTGAGALSSMVVQMYSATDGGYVTSETEPTISPWQGFWAEAGATGTLTIPVSARTSGGTFVRRTATPRIAFELSTADGSRRDRAAVLRFSDDANDGADALDAVKRSPAAASFVTLSLEGSADGDAVLRAVETRAMPTTPTVVPMHARAVGTSGDVVMTWPRPDLPDDWTAELRDLATGAVVDLRERASYVFSLSPTAARTTALAPDLGLVPKTDAARFELLVGPGSLVATDADGADAVSLAPPFPNPSRGQTRVPFTLATAGTVRLSVVDALGREVAVLADGSYAGGAHAPTLDTRRLATGTYVVRLIAGDRVMTQRLTVAR